MNIIVLGCGNIGSVVTKDLAESLPKAKIVMADSSESRAEAAASKIGCDNVSWLQIDASNHKQLIATLRKFDSAVDALPGSMGFQVCKAATAAHVNMVDVSYMPEDVMTLDDAASKAEICIIPDCGFSPGLSNIMVGHAVSQLDRVNSVHIFNGGLPEKPVPPLGYVITWSVKDLIDMYRRKPIIVKDGKKKTVEAMSGLEEIIFPNVGRLEAFYTDGLRTLLSTVKVAEDMWEKTLRYPGHVEKVTLLKTLGLFDEKPVELEGMKMVPREFTALLLERMLKRPDVPDIVAMLIEVGGEKKQNQFTITYQMFERYDRQHRVTAMGRTTAYTASVVAQLMARGALHEKGVVPPERLGMNSGFYRRFVSEMKKRSVTVTESK